jgi:hypothetical protein
MMKTPSLFIAGVSAMLLSAGLALGQTAANQVEPYVVHSTDGKYEFSIDTSRAPDLTDWATNKLASVLAEWYPKIVEMLPSDGFAAPARFTVMLKPGNGVAFTSGTRIVANSNWLKRELNGEAVGALVHEAVHVVQQYGHTRRDQTNAVPAPGWLVEGMADYIRWFKYEPQSHGADVGWLRPQKHLSLRYDAGYRVTANFLDWVAGEHGQDIIRQLNAAMREGRYADDIWKQSTGKTVQELGADWKSSREKIISKSP